MDKDTLKIIILGSIFFLMLGGFLIWKVVAGDRVISQIGRLSIVPSEESGGAITFREGAKAVISGMNLLNVEFRQINDNQSDIFSGTLICNGTKSITEDGKEKWESAPLSAEKIIVKFCAIGFDPKGKLVGYDCLFKVKGLTEKEIQQAEQNANNKKKLDDCLAAVEEKYNKISSDYFDSCIQTRGQSDSAMNYCMEWAITKEQELNPQVKSAQNSCYKKYPVTE